MFILEGLEVLEGFDGVWVDVGCGWFGFRLPIVFLVQVRFMVFFLFGIGE